MSVEGDFFVAGIRLSCYTWTRITRNGCGKMKKLHRVQAVCICAAIICLVLFAIETFDAHNVIASRVSGALVLACLIVNAVCAAIRASREDDE